MLEMKNFSNHSCFKNIGRRHCFKHVARLLCLVPTVLLSMQVEAKRETFNVEMQRPIGKKSAQTTKLDVNVKYLAARFGTTADQLTLTAAGTYALQAEIPGGQGSGAAFKTFTNGTGHWFRSNGTPCEKVGDTERRVCVKYENGKFCVAHRPNTDTNVFCEVGDVFRFAELVIHGTDTVRYAFAVTIVADGEAETVTTDQTTRTYAHRKDMTDDWGALPLVMVNDEKPAARNWVQVNVGDRLALSGVVQDTESYDSVYTCWQNKAGKRLSSFSGKPFVLTESATTDLCGEYVMQARLYKKGVKSFKTVSYNLYVDVQEHAGEMLKWEGLLPKFSYNFKDEYGEIPMPTKILGDVGDTDRHGKPVNRVSGDWWTVAWGSDLNKECGTDEATVRACAENMIKKYDTDFAYIRDVMGWPPDIRARKGYKSLIYIFGSGLKNDNTPNTEKGGYQSAIWYNDPLTKESRNWPCVWASYYPFSRFRTDADKIFGDGDYQREAMIHEGIHALFADMDGCKNSAWFHEAGNTWLQSAMSAKRSGKYGTPGFLDGCPFMAPFMPIECYSGWLQDGSFGGPSAEGVNMFQSDGKQVCTWRTWLGGNQYGNSFPIVLAEMCGDGSIPWIWRNCKNRVLEGIGQYIGDEAMRTLIVQYRARQAIYDLGPWSNGYRTAAGSYFGNVIGPEWEPYNVKCADWKVTPYQRMTLNDDEGWLAPDQLTNPGWSGANIIPIHIQNQQGPQTVKVTFRPEDTQMRAILCFKTKQGKAYYSQVVRCGDMVLNLPTGVRPANNVVFCVVCNTDYIYTGEEQRKHHWDYRIHLGESCLGIADQHKRWFMNEQTITDNDYEDLSYTTTIEELRLPYTELQPAKADARLADKVRLMSGMIMSGRDIRVACTDVNPADVQVGLAGLQGIVESRGHLTADGTFRMPTGLRPGLYVLVLSHAGERVSYKVIVK